MAAVTPPVYASAAIPPQRPTNRRSMCLRLGSPNSRTIHTSSSILRTLTRTPLSSRIMRQEHGLYSRVLAQTLVNEQATVEAILKGLEWLERNMSPRDVAAVFFSSHGANDASRQFYLLPYEVNVQDDITLRRSALRYADLRDTLVHLAERGKTLLFLDACY